MENYTNKTSIMLPAELTDDITEEFTEGKIAELSNGKNILFKDVLSDYSCILEVEDFNSDTIQIYKKHIISIKTVKVGIAKSKQYSFVVAFKFLKGEAKFDYSFTYNKGRMIKIPDSHSPSFRDYQENIKSYNSNIECVLLLLNKN